ncbi:MAG: PQQ-binding-like beta-propeller repeat protein [Methanocella sp.]
MRRRNSLLIILLLLLTISQTCSLVQAAPNDWPMFQHDIARSGSTHIGDATDSAQLLWTFQTGASVWSSPIVTGDYVYVGGGDGYLYCLNATSGNIMWQYFGDVGGSFSTPAVSDGHLYVSSSKGNFSCIEADTGRLVWETNLNGALWSSPLVLGDYIYVGSSNARLYCLEASSGTVLSFFQAVGTINSAPAYAEGLLYFSSEYYLYALNASTLELVWHAFTSSGSNSPATYNGSVYIGSTDGALYSFNAHTGTENWRHVTHGFIVSSPAAAYGYVYVASEDNNVYCLDAIAGSLVWCTATGFWICSSPAVADGNLYVGSQDCNVYCLDAYTGAVKWSFATEEAVNSSPSIANNTLYIGSSDRKVYALTLLNATADNPPLLALDSWALSTIILDVALFAVFASVVPAAYVLHKRKEKPLNVQTPKQPWYKAHLDLLVVIVILACSALLFVNLDNAPMWPADEQTYAQWSFHMLKTGDYLTPWNFGVVSLWIGKPPLTMWLVSVAYQVFGATNFAARFWSVIFGGLSLAMMYHLGKLLYNRAVGVLSVVVLATCVMFVTFATRYMTDVPLLFFMLASLYFLLLSKKSAPQAKNVLAYAGLGGVFFGLALMTKQTEALLIPAIAGLYLVLTAKSFKPLFTRRFLLFLTMALVVVAPYLIVMHVNFGSEFWGYYFTYSTFERVVNPIEGHQGDILFYFNYLATNENPLWMALLPFGLGLSAYWALKRSKSDALIVTWVAVVFAVFTVAQTKMPYYILPVYPAFAFAIGSLLYWMSRKIWLFKQKTP